MWSLSAWVFSCCGQRAGVPGVVRCSGATPVGWQFRVARAPGEGPVSEVVARGPCQLGLPGRHLPHAPVRRWWLGEGSGAAPVRGRISARAVTLSDLEEMCPSATRRLVISWIGSPGVPAPGGGAAAALQVAMGAALVGMAARYTAGGEDGENKAAIGRIIAEADEPRGIALRLAAAEAACAAEAIARVNIEINLAGITDEQASLEMIAETGKAQEIIASAEQLSDTVREQIRA